MTRRFQDRRIQGDSPENGERSPSSLAAIVIGSLLFYGAILFWLAPVVLGLIDSACWFLTGVQCSATPWDENRYAFSIAWVFAWPLLLVLVLSFAGVT